MYPLFMDVVYINAELRVPKESVEAYKNADIWENFSNIVGIDASGNANGDVDLSILFPEGGLVKQTYLIGDAVSMQFEPTAGWVLNSVTLNGEDVTDDVASDGRYTTPVLVDDATLAVVFEKSGDGGINDLSVSDIRVYAREGVVTISGADAFSNATVYNLDGAVIYSGTDKSISLDESGVYLLTVKGRTFKFAI